MDDAGCRFGADCGDHVHGYVFFSCLLWLEMVLDSFCSHTYVSRFLKYSGAGVVMRESRGLEGKN